MKSIVIRDLPIFAIFVFFAASSVGTSCVFAQNSVGGGVEMDATAFRLDSTHAQIEIEYGILYRLLPFTKVVNGASSAPISATAEIWQGGVKVASQDISQNVPFSGTQKQLEDASANKVIGTLSFVVPYSPHTKAVLLWNYKNASDGLSVDKPERDVEVDSSTSHIALSGIELASSVEKPSAPGNPLEKAGYVVTPNPSGIYGESYTKLYYYVELYVPQDQVDPSQSVEIVSTIVNGASKQIATESRTQKLLNGVIPFIGSINIDGLETDSYNLVVSIKKDGIPIQQMSKRFYFQSDIKLSEEPAPAQAPLDPQTVYLNSEISRMSDAELDQSFEYSRYLTTSDQKKAYGKLKELDAKRKFLFDYWLKRDKSGQQPLTAYTDYKLRIEAANAKYSYQKTPGWKSDKGRIFIMYGQPDRMQSVPFQVSAKAYELWEYNNHSWQLQPSGGEQSGNLNLTPNLPHFIFLDRQEAGKYVLVHSNVQGETYEPNWYSMEATKTH